MMPTSEQAQLIANLKKMPGRTFAIPIQLHGGDVVGNLLPITFQMAEKDDLVATLCRWRQAHLTKFLTVFEPSLDKTRVFLKEFSLPDPTRILFMIENIDQYPVGHFGFCKITADRAELDNVIRGEIVNVPNFMFYSQVTLLRWAFHYLDLELVYLNVLTHNTRAIRSYQKIGFTAAGEQQLMQQSFDDGYKLVPASGPVGKLTDLMLMRMEIDRDSFYRNHPPAQGRNSETR